MKQVFVLSAEEFTSIDDDINSLIEYVTEDKESESRDWMLKILYGIQEILICYE